MREVMRAPEAGEFRLRSKVSDYSSEG
jgi:hypothetical protein